MEHVRALEGYLFYKGEPVGKKDISEFFAIGAEETALCIARLRESLVGRGVALVETDTEVALKTALELSPMIERLRREELKRDIGRAGAETLAIILYRGPVARSEIDHIRGVNSSFILRNLLIRGLIERETNPQDERSFRYRITTELLAHLGIRSATELPEYEAVLAELDRFDRERVEAIENPA